MVTNKVNKTDSAWADSAEADWPSNDKRHKPARSNGLSKFGRRVVYEMNRLGMIVDISHTSRATMLDVLDISLGDIIIHFDVD